MVFIIHLSLSFVLSVPYGHRTGSATIISDNDNDMDTFNFYTSNVRITAVLS